MATGAAINTVGCCSMMNAKLRNQFVGTIQSASVNNKYSAEQSKKIDDSLACE